MTETLDHIRLADRSIETVASILGLENFDLTEFSMPEAEEIWGMENRALGLILALIKSVSPSVVVELGTYKGRSAAAIGALLKNIGHGKLFTVDDFRAIECTDSERLFNDLELNDVVVQICGTTSEAFSNWGRERIDVLIIDAAHDFVSACTDIALWSRLLSPTGWMIIHDTRTRLLRRFPEDYIHPLYEYQILDISDVKPGSTHYRWEGLAFVRFKRRNWEDHTAQGMTFSRERVRWGGALELSDNG